MDPTEVKTDGLLPVSKAAKCLGISRVTAYQWIKDGKLDSVKIGGVLFVPVGEIERKVGTG